MDRQRVILVHGLARSGKDTVSDMIEKYYTGGLLRFAFADPIKRILCTSLGIDLRTLEHFKEDTKARLKFISPIQSMCTGTNTRQLHQNFGNDAMKAEFGINVWANVAHNKIQDSEISTILITDFRVMEEYIVLKEHYDIVTIQVLRDSAVVGDSHVTESGLSGFAFDYTIKNSGTLEELDKKVKALVKKIK